MDFNEIKNIWKNSFETDSLSESQIESQIKINCKSNIVLNKIMTNYKYGIIGLSLLYLITVFFLFIFLKVDIAFLLFILLSLFSVLSILIATTNLNKIKATVNSDDNVITTLNKTIFVMEKSLRFGMGNLYKYLIIPFALILGMAIGIYISSGEKGFVNTIVNLETRSIVKMILVLIGGSTISIILSQFIMKRMYKNNLDELKKCLHALEDINEV